MGKFFQIEQSQPQRKSFVIQPSASQKEFTIATSSVYPVELPGTNRHIQFAHQENASDCGPCLVINILSSLGANSSYDTVLNVRQAANTIRSNNQQSQLPENDWFFTYDVAQSLQTKGVNVESFSIKSTPMERQATARRNLLETHKTPYTIYTGSGRHFKGIYWDGDRYYLLDSMLRNIPLAGSTDIDILIGQAKRSERNETVAIATRRN